jgi:hypothetical protein
LYNLTSSSRSLASDSWDSDLAKCRAIAFGFSETVLGEVIVDHAAGEGSAQFRVEDRAERHLRAMLELRH